MCGRYALDTSISDLEDAFFASSKVKDALPSDWNISPTKEIYFVSGDNPQGSERSIDVAHWGIIPSWSKDASRASNAINARVESIAEKPSFSSALRSRRCLIPASGYFEWATALGPYAPKQPFYIFNKDQSLLPMAGLFEYWVNPATGKTITSASIITRESVGRIATIHHRMPIMLPPDRWDQWLSNEKLSESQVPDYLNLLDLENPEAGLDFRPVSIKVNNARNAGANLIEGIELTEPVTLF
jgi:putative SOS response-associated peptidase YedK